MPKASGAAGEQVGGGGHDTACRRPEVSLARVRRPQGRRGELRVEVLTDFLEHLWTIRRAFMTLPGKEPFEVDVESARPVRDGAVIKTSAASSIDEAEALVGGELMVPRDEAWPLPEGSYFHFDLVGCDVLLDQGQLVGRVAAVTGGENPLLVIEPAGGLRGELLVPFCQEICRRIDLRNRQVWITPPEGLLELNAV